MFLYALCATVDQRRGSIVSLFAGLLIFFGWEVLPMIVKEFKKRYRDRKEFLRLMEERMQQV